MKVVVLLNSKERLTSMPMPVLAAEADLLTIRAAQDAVRTGADPGLLDLKWLSIDPGEITSAHIGV